ncbi:lysozyme inhibitor LprI family protein [Pseudomonas sp. 10B1]|uniref:lysozyme inhibitor LprI family protein n=1 Tax=unclassified Pseudomonas TaxID=196821 RepID=UPI002AB54513|nr:MULTISPECIES: lysozyme inhibitor LprI family protein [unclassified Pseudomonas]MDY7559787.1 lysozyme inhibitor LprI family protein [Pseudomonas sp. AB6]MEA9976618.1 lysozyme inhibitor LprI family protein [Pseudomonas sp. RTS4]MEA9992976.1 lysozyme inhibitor LprI family protein [Pseudomonas sp. AA4]MEB0085919.1 lysozyme inhibitor LprI family protein [Pseudomonas sp. RTI1]MEB0125646.1 lysozyme inhibitor LprI family protein [Pseudomonas sp. CCC1.2]
MRYLMTIVMTLGIGLANVPTALADDCEANQTAMNACAGRDLANADADLNRQYQAQMAYLKTPARKLALKNAQIKWIAFREADCLYQVGKPEDSGSIWPLLHAQCMAALTLQRVEQLKAYGACRQAGCPD